MRFGRGNLRGGNLIVETLILPHFLRLPRQVEVVTYEVTILERCLSNYIITRYHWIVDMCISVCIFTVNYVRCSIFFLGFQEVLQLAFSPNGSLLYACLFDVHWPDFWFFEKFRPEEGPFHYRLQELCQTKLIVTCRRHLKDSRHSVV